MRREAVYFTFSLIYVHLHSYERFKSMPILSDTRSDEAYGRKMGRRFGLGFVLFCHCRIEFENIVTFFVCTRTLEKDCHLSALFEAVKCQVLSRYCIAVRSAATSANSS